MPRIDIELTSCRPDGSWTWRAAGARQPKGAMEAALLPNGAAVGDRLKADVEFDLDGNRVTGVTQIRAKKESGADRLAIIGSGRDEPPVTTNMRGGLAGADDQRRSKPRREGGARPPRAPGGRTDSRERPSGRDGVGGARRSSGPEDRGRGRDDGRGPGGRPGSREARPGPGRSDQPRSDQARPPRPPRERTAPANVRPAPPRAKRLQAKRAHRDAVLADIAPELRPVAEKVLRGGVAAVRQALDEQNAAARSAGAEEVKTDGLVAAAEELAPKLRVAEWWDRAEAALADVDEISVRDLRSVVAGSDAARDEQTRTLAASLREALSRRSETEKQAWVDDIGTSLDDGRIVRALRLSSRPPEPGSRLSAELSTRLAQAAGAALSPASGDDRWLAVLEAVLVSPVRRTVEPQGLPAEAGPAVTRAATGAASRVPALAALLGISPSASGNRPPPPPRPVAAPRPPRRPPPPPAPPAPPVSEAGAPDPVTIEPVAIEPVAPELVVTEAVAPELVVPEAVADEPPGSGLSDDADDPVLMEELGQTVDQG